MPKKTSAPVATISPEILAKHPLMLTRALDEVSAPILAGEYTLDQLRQIAGVEGDESTVLLELSSLGCAFFSQNGSYYAFKPLQGDLNLPIDAESVPTTEEVAAAEFTTEIIDPDESGDAEASVYDPDGEGEPDYSDWVKEEVEELEANPNPSHYPHTHPEPAIEPAAPAQTDDAPTDEQTPAAADLEDSIEF